MGISLWKCPDCGNQSSMAIKKCRKCGRHQPAYGIVNKPKAPKKVTPPKAPKKPSPKADDEIFFESTLVMKDN